MNSKSTSLGKGIVMMDSELMKVNISGSRFEVPTSLVDHALRISQLNTPNCTTFIKTHDSYYFPRNVGCFEAVLDYLSLNELHMPSSVCPAVFKREMDFWGIDVQELQSCCKLRLDIFLDEVDVLNQQHLGGRTATAHINGRATWRGFLDKSFENPGYSVFGKVYFWIAMAFVGLSLFVLCAETLPHFREKLTTDEWRDYFGKDFDENFNMAIPTFDGAGDFDERMHINGSRGPLPRSAFSLNIHIKRLSIAADVFFCADILVRFCVAQSKLRFLASILNITDIVAMIAFNCRVVVVEVHPRLLYIPSYMDFATAIGSFRAFRVFRLAGQSRGLYVFLHSLKAGLREIWLLVLFLFTGGLVFSSFLYIFERPNNIDSIPAAFWWSIVTMTTVGYGDVVPKSIPGKLLGSLCAVSGVLVMAVTVPLFANKFALYYNRIGHPTSRLSKKPRRCSRSCVTPVKCQCSGSGT